MNPNIPGVSPDVSDRIADLLRRGQKIEAIKELRQAHPQFGLKESKDACDAMEREMGIVRQSSGCLGVLALLAVLLPIAVRCWS